MTLPRGTLGYRIDLERPAYLEQHGHDPRLMLKAAETLPAFNPVNSPLDVLAVKNQKSVGACQGFALSSCFAICYWRATGRKEVFSAMAAYILSQKVDGIRGDKGSTLSGGNNVATKHGLCLDPEWKFTGRYSAREPSPKPNYAYKLKTSKPLKDIGLVMDWMNAGLPVQWGISWGNEMDREVVDSFSGRGGGGHSVLTWLVRDSDSVICVNSWGANWNGDGCHIWTRRAMEQMLRHRWTVAIGYGPEQMEMPPLEPLT